MKDKNRIGATVISHDSESRTYVPSQNRLRDIHYTGASLSQLASVTSVSSHCEQFIKYECYDSGLYLRNPASWWMSRDSAKMTYWGGASPGSGKCACGMTNSCADSRFGCNCDKDDYVWREDSGLLTDKTTLPVIQLYIGDVSGPKEKGYYTLGKLKCYGIAWTCFILNFFSQNDSNRKSLDVKCLWHIGETILCSQICNSNLKFRYYDCTGIAELKSQWTSDSGDCRTPK